MTTEDTYSRFSTTLLQPKNSSDDKPWAFVVLPKDVSGKLPRRGRTTVEVTINGVDFQVLAEPDGQKSHWLKIDGKLVEDAGLAIGSTAELEIMSAKTEPEPEVPDDFQTALNAAPESQATWEATTTIARLDWIHWITTAKQAKTRAKRINDACDMLASGKKRVCCFDPSGFYSKAFSAPEAESMDG